MDNNKPKNLPAFSRAAFASQHSGNFWVDSQDGMTLLDYFAAKAMVAHITNPHRIPGSSPAEEISQKAYELAQAMLKEREKYIK